MKVKKAAFDETEILVHPEARNALGGVHRMRVLMEVVQNPRLEFRTLHVGQDPRLFGMYWFAGGHAETSSPE